MVKLDNMDRVVAIGRFSFTLHKEERSQQFHAIIMKNPFNDKEFVAYVLEMGFSAEGSTKEKSLENLTAVCANNYYNIIQKQEIFEEILVTKELDELWRLYRLVASRIQRENPEIFDTVPKTLYNSAEKKIEELQQKLQECQEKLASVEVEKSIKDDKSVMAMGNIFLVDKKVA